MLRLTRWFGVTGSDSERGLAREQSDIEEIVQTTLLPINDSPEFAAITKVLATSSPISGLSSLRFNGKLRVTSRGVSRPRVAAGEWIRSGLLRGPFDRPAPFWRKP
jgi:hypothetical protein